MAAIIVICDKIEKITASDFDKIEDYAKCDQLLKEIQESFADMFKKLMDEQKCRIICSGFRIIFEMVQNCRGLVQFQGNIRFGKAFFPVENFDCEKFIEQNIPEESRQNMDFSEAETITDTQKRVFLRISTLMLEFREFYVELTKRFFNMGITHIMAETFVDKCVMTPSFEVVEGGVLQSISKS